jgi:hypothetical protein
MVIPLAINAPMIVIQAPLILLLPHARPVVILALTLNMMALNAG